MPKQSKHLAFSKLQTQRIHGTESAAIWRLKLLGNVANLHLQSLLKACGDWLDLLLVSRLFDESWAVVD